MLIFSATPGIGDAAQFRRSEIEQHRDHQRKDDLPGRLGTRHDALADNPAAADAFQVVDKAEDAEGDQRAHGHQHRLANQVEAQQVGEVQQAGDDDHGQDHHQAAHGGRAHLHLVQSRLLDADLLTHLVADQPVDQRPAPDDGQKEGDGAQCQRIGHRARPLAPRLGQRRHHVVHVRRTRSLNQHHVARANN